MTSISRSAASLDSVPRPFVVCVRFELDFPPLISIGVAVFGVAVLVNACAAGAAPVPAGGVIPITSSVGTAGEDTNSSW